MAGRPTKYREEHCDKLIEHLKKGGSLESFAAIIDVNPDTVFEWLKVHEAFSEAKKVGDAHNLNFFERLAISGMTGQLTRKQRQYVKDPETGRRKLKVDEDGQPIYREVPATFNSTAWIFMMKNRHNWRDKRELSGPGGGPVAYADQTNEQLLEKFNALMQRSSDTMLALTQKKKAKK